MLKNEVNLSYIHNIRNYSTKIYNELIINYYTQRAHLHWNTAALERRASLLVTGEAELARSSAC